MKARVKATGEIVEVLDKVMTPIGSVGQEHRWVDAKSGKSYSEEELFFSTLIDDDSDYWGKLLHQYAGMAMQGFISNSVFFKEVDHVTNGKPENLIAAFAINISTALVEKLKKEK